MDRFSFLKIFLKERPGLGRQDGGDLACGNETRLSFGGDRRVKEN
jgi:hypothetical protein